MSLFPLTSFENVEEITTTDIPIAKEWAWDFTINDFKLKNGKPYLVEGLEAVQIWAIKALKTRRFAHTVYSWNYGSEIEDLIGSDYSKAAIESEVKRMCSECLLSNPNIIDVTDIDTFFDGDRLEVSLNLITVYGDVEVKGIDN